MKVLIGITQAPDETEQRIYTEFEDVGTAAIVGPFLSSDEAARWMKYMLSRTGSYTQLPSPTTPLAGQYWYGITCEYAMATEHCSLAAL